MHPGPMNRGVEIDSKLADDITRSLIQEQVSMGVAVRMACLEILINNKDLYGNLITSISDIFSIIFYWFYTFCIYFNKNFWSMEISEKSAPVTLEPLMCLRTGKKSH